MIEIKRIEFWGFKQPKYKVDINLKGKISILFGENGCGKTTVLRLINAVLAQREEVLIKESVKMVKINYSDDAIEKELEIDFDEKEEKYNWANMENSQLKNSTSIMIGVQRGVPTSHSAVPTSLIYEYFIHSSISREMFDMRNTERSKIRFFANELADFLNRNRQTQKRKGNDFLPEGRHITVDDINIENIELSLQNTYERVKQTISFRIYNALFETFAYAIEQNKATEIELPKNFIEILDKNKEKLIEALEDAPDNEFKETVIRRLQSLNILSQDELLENKLFAKLLLQMVKELEQEKIALGTINVLIESFNELLSDNKKLEIDRDGIRININGAIHGISGLSSGERHLLTFLTVILLDGFSRNFILIDEPEISLNVIWQEKLLRIISQIAPNSQIITASHSPSIVEDHTNCLVEINKTFLI